MQKIEFEQESSLDYRTNEAYKQLRTNICFCGSDVKVILVTSCTPNEGKTSISFHLASSFAESEKKVLFIDADLRKSVLVGRYKVNQGVQGLTHYLSGQMEFDDVVYETNIENLYTVFSGPIPPNPAELLGNQLFKNLINEARESFDYIIIDTPPLGSVIDSAVVASECDGAILALASASVSYKFAQKTMEQLEKSDCKILGTVLNKVMLNKQGYYGRYYGRYYGKYYGKYYGTEYGEY